MHFSEWFIRRPVGTSLLAIAITLAGAICYFLLPVSPLPQVEYPTVSVGAGLPGASPETMASAVATPLERALGTPLFVLLYALGLLGSSATTAWLHRREPGYASLGASGAISAVLFASIVVFPTAAIYILPLPFPIPAPLFAVAYLVFSVWASRARTGRINHDAHIAGALAGVVFMAVVAPGSVGRAWASFFGG